MNLRGSSRPSESETMQNYRRIVKGKSLDSANLLGSKRRLNRRSLKMRRRRESYRNAKLSCRDKSKLNSIAKSKRNWSSSVWPRSNGV